MANKTKLYRVSMSKGFPLEASHRRAGLVLQSNDVLEVELTTDQVKEIQDDRFMDIKEVRGKKEGDDQSGDATPSADQVQPDADQVTPDADSAPQGDAPEAPVAPETDGSGVQGNEVPADGTGEPDAPASDTPEEPVTKEAPTAAQLLKDNNRDKLVELAQAAGVELDFADQATNTKKVIAEAIVAARG